LTGGNENVAIGRNAGNALATGNYNSLFGSGSGTAYTSESGNICIGRGTVGVGGENNTLHIGDTGGAITAAYIAGISGAAPVDANSPQVVVCDSTSNLSVVPDTTAGYVLTSNAPDAPTFQPAGGGLLGSTPVGAPYTTILGDTGAITATGVNNVAIGFLALNAVGTSDHNTAVGCVALGGLSSGTTNTAVGDHAMAGLTGASGNTGIGNIAFQSLVTGSENTGIGDSCGSAYNGSEANNIIIGANVAGVTGENNTLHIGDTGGGITSSFIGGIYGVSPTDVNSPQVVVCDNTSKLTVVSDSNAGYVLTSNSPDAPSFQPPGGFITITADSGSVSGNSLTLYAQNFGANCGCTVLFSGSGTELDFQVEDGQGNIAIGKSAGNTSFDTGCTNNVCIGDGALTALTSGDSNTAVGRGAAGNIISSSSNCYFGDACGGAHAGSESGNILIGAFTAGVLGENNTLHIGDTGGSITASYIAGISGVTVTGTAVLCSTAGKLGTVVSSIELKENVKELESKEQSILSLRPVQFNYKSDQDKNVCFGMIAEEVDKMFPELVLYKDGKPYGIKYHEMPALLLLEIQKLNRRIQQLESK
jgi:hypothetical protein